MEVRHAQYEQRVATLNLEQMHKQLNVMDKMTKEMLKHITKVGLSPALPSALPLHAV